MKMAIKQTTKFKDQNDNGGHAKLLGLSDDAHSLSTQGRMPKTRSRLAPSNTFKGKNAQASAEFLDGDTRLTGALFIEAIVRLSLAGILMFLSLIIYLWRLLGYLHYIVFSKVSQLSIN